MHLFLSRVKVSILYLSSIFFNRKEDHVEGYVRHCIACYSQMLEDQDCSDISPDRIEKVLHTQSIMFAYLSSALYEWFPKTRDSIRKEVYMSCKRKAIWYAKNVK